MKYQNTVLRPYKRNPSGNHITSTLAWLLITLLLFLISSITILGLNEGIGLGYIPEWTVPMIDFYFTWIFGPLLLIVMISLTIALIRTVIQLAKTIQRKTKRQNS